MKELPPHISMETTRHGRKVLYFRRGHGTRVRMPEDPNTAEFREKYNRLINRKYTTVMGVRRIDEQEAARMMAKKLKAAKTRDRANGRASDIDMGWIKSAMAKQDHRCALTGIPFQWAGKAASRINPYFPSIDRIDNSRGYTRDNVQIVLTAINLMRSDWGDGVFDHIVFSYAEQRIPAPRSRAGRIRITPIETQEEFSETSQDGDPDSYARHGL